MAEGDQRSIHNDGDSEQSIEVISREPSPTLKEVDPDYTPPSPSRFVARGSRDEINLYPRKDRSFSKSTENIHRSSVDGNGFYMGSIDATDFIALT